MNFKTFYVTEGKPELKDNEFAIPMHKKLKNKKLNPKSNRMKTFKINQYHVTSIPESKRTFENLPKYADGKSKVSFMQWFNIKKESDSSYGKGCDGKYYGWSHRAVYGFQKGDSVSGDNLGKKCTYGKYTKDDLEKIKLENKDNSGAFYLPKLGSVNFDNATYENDFTIKNEEHAKQVAKQFAKNVS